MKEEQRNMFLAIALSLGVVMLWQVFFAPELTDPAELETIDQAAFEMGDGSLPYPTDGGTSQGLGGMGSGAIDRDAALQLSARVEIDAPGVDGSISLAGARIDDLHLRHFRETIDPESPEITLLSPSGSEDSYYVEFGWLPAPGVTATVPGRSSIWTPANPNTVLTPETPLTLVWSNGEGLTFSRLITVDDDYMFNVTQTVTNSTNRPVTLHPYGLIARRGEPEGNRFWIAYEGLFGYLDGQRHTASYKNLRDDGEVSYSSSDGWVGITDKFWMTALAPENGVEFEGRFTYRENDGVEFFQSDYRMNGQVIPAGGSVDISTRLFAGAKVVELIEQYRNEDGIQRFDLSMDWGWFFFLTKPFFWALLYLKGLLGNFGLAILAFTVLVKLVIFPLANKSYESMAKMRKVQPQIEKIREIHGDDKVKQQQEMMELYKREKLNPLAGCLPMLVQIPVFFALYQVLFVTIEMRHAPFYGWIHDLSAPDPTSLFNLFGLLPWSVEALAAVPLIGSLLTIGVWPLIMGFSMWFQFQLNPPPPDPMQRRMFALMPFFFMFLLANFSAGLVIYWAWNNFLSIVQQTVIMKRLGVAVNPFERIKLPGFMKNAFASSGVPKAERDMSEAEAEPEAEAESESVDEVVEDVIEEPVEEADAEAGDTETEDDAEEEADDEIEEEEEIVIEILDEDGEPVTSFEEDSSGWDDGTDDPYDDDEPTKGNS